MGSTAKIVPVTETANRNKEETIAKIKWLYRHIERVINRCLIWHHADVTYVTFAIHFILDGFTLKGYFCVYSKVLLIFNSRFKTNGIATIDLRRIKGQRYNIALPIADGRASYGIYVFTNAITEFPPILKVSKPFFIIPLHV